MMGFIESSNNNTKVNNQTTKELCSQFEKIKKKRAVNNMGKSEKRRADPRRNSNPTRQGARAPRPTLPPSVARCCGRRWPRTGGGARRARSRL